MVLEERKYKQVLIQLCSYFTYRPWQGIKAKIVI